MYMCMHVHGLHVLVGYIIPLATDMIGLCVVRGLYVGIQIVSPGCHLHNIIAVTSTAGHFCQNYIVLVFYINFLRAVLHS
jgi:hypothetical protein